MGKHGRGSALKDSLHQVEPEDFITYWGDATRDTPFPMMVGMDYEHALPCLDRFVPLEENTNASRRRFVEFAVETGEMREARLRAYVVDGACVCVGSAAPGAGRP